jgi:hypothetical protein
MDAWRCCHTRDESQVNGVGLSAVEHRVAHSGSFLRRWVGLLMMTTRTRDPSPQSHKRHAK